MRKLKLSIYLILPVLFILNACSSSDKELLSTENSIIEFAIGDKKATINEEEKTIKLELSYAADLAKVRPAVTVSSRATVTPASGAEVDFTKPVTYKVLAENGDAKSYIATATKEKSPVAKITSFTFPIGETKVEATIDEETKKITATAPFGSDISKVVPTVAFSGASISLEAGKAIDLTKEQKVTVTADAGNEVVYTINITVAASDVANILTFAFNTLTPKVVATIDGTTITATVPFEAEWTKLVPTITFEGKDMSPKSEVAQDFSKDVLYTVTAANGEKIVYTVKVTKTISSDAELVKFSFNGLNPKVDGVLNPSTRIVNVDVPFETDLTKLVPTIEFKGHEIKPASGVAQNFEEQVEYKITAQDGKTDYQFSVMVFKNPFQPIIESLNKLTVIREGEITITGRFAANNNRVELVNGTLKSAMSIVSQNEKVIVAKVSPLAGYGEYNVRVYSNNGNTTYEQEKVRVLSIDEATPKIESFSITQYTSIEPVIDNERGTVNIELPYDAPIHRLGVQIKHDGVSMTPPFKTQNDFTNPIVSVLEGKEGVKKSYTFTVSTAYFDTQITSVSSNIVRQGEILQIQGEIGGGLNREIVELVDNQNKTYTFSGASIIFSSKQAVTVDIPTDLPVGDYTLFVTSHGTKAEYKDSKITIDKVFTPGITSIDKTTVIRETEYFTVKGMFVKDNTSISFTSEEGKREIASIFRFSPNELLVKASKNIRDGKHKVGVNGSYKIRENGKWVTKTYSIPYGEMTVTIPQKPVLKLDKSVYKKSVDTQILMFGDYLDLNFSNSEMLIYKNGDKEPTDFGKNIGLGLDKAIVKLEKLPVGSYRMRYDVRNANSYSNYVNFEVTE